MFPIVVDDACFAVIVGNEVLSSINLKILDKSSVIKLYLLIPQDCINLLSFLMFPIVVDDACKEMSKGPNYIAFFRNLK
jgi:hypothetical protein